MSKRGVEEISAFERKRLANIAANNEVLKDISAAAGKIRPTPPKPTSKPRGKTTIPKVRVVPKRDLGTATRASARLRGATADSTDDSKAALGLNAGDDGRPAKKLRTASDLALGTVSVEGRSFSKGIAAFKEMMLPRRGADPGHRTFDLAQVKSEGANADTNAAIQRMSGLTLYDKWEPNSIKIVPQRIYSMGFHPSEDKKIIFAGDKEGAMGLFDASQEVPVMDDEDDDPDLPNPAIVAFKTHMRTITGFHIPSVNHSTLYTSSYDSSIRILDLSTGSPTSIQVWAPADAGDDMPISAIDGPTSEPKILVFSTLNGALGRLDTRTKPGDAEIWQLSDYKIGGFSLHPQVPHLVATASLDRTLKIWDLRKITGRGGTSHPAVVGEHASLLSVSHASWNSAGQIATSSYDDTIKIHGLWGASSWNSGHTLTEAEMQPQYSIKHNNQTGRWVTILKPQWQKHPRDGVQKFAIGNMNRFVDIYGGDGTQLAQLDGEGITAVPAVCHLHPTMDWVVGGTASGKVCLWL